MDQRVWGARKETIAAIQREKTEPEHKPWWRLQGRSWFESLGTSVGRTRYWLEVGGEESESRTISSSCLGEWQSHQGWGCHGHYLKLFFFPPFPVHCHGGNTILMPPISARGLLTSLEILAHYPLGAPASPFLLQGPLQAHQAWQWGVGSFLPRPQVLPCSVLPPCSMNIYLLGQVTNRRPKHQISPIHGLYLACSVFTLLGGEMQGSDPPTGSILTTKVISSPVSHPSHPNCRGSKEMTGFL